MSVKSIKKDKGFSLVELIIAVVILGIISIVAIGGLYSWVTKSRQNTDIANCGTIKEALWASVPSAKFPSLGYKYCWIAQTGKRSSNPSNPEKDNSENPFNRSYVYNTDGSLTAGCDKTKFESWYTKSMGSKKFSDNTYDSLITSKTNNRYTVLIYVDEAGTICNIKVILTKDIGLSESQLKDIISYYDSDFTATPSDSNIVYDGVNKFFD